MALTTENPPTITGRGGIGIMFYIPTPDTSETQYGKLTVQIKFSNNEITERSFDLLERLGDDDEGTSTHLPALSALKSYLISRVNSEMLGL